MAFYNEIVVKRFLPENKDEIIHLIHRTIRVCYPEVYCAEVVEFFLDYHSKDEILRKATKGEMVIAYLREKLIACGYLYGSEIGGVYVEPQNQHKGYGKLIVTELLKIATSKKIAKVWLDATPLALKLYLNLGFVLQERMVDIVKGDKPLEYYRMTKKLF